MDRGRVWSLPRRQFVALAVIAIVVVGSVPFVATGIDWSTILRPATLTFLRLGNPYQIEGTYSPPWLFVMLAPLAVLPTWLGAVMLFWLDIATWVFVARRLGSGSALQTLAIVTSPMVVNGLLARNVDFLVIWGLLLPPEVAVYLLTIKPQVGGAVLAFLAVQEYRRGGVRRLVRIFLVPCLVSLLAFLVYRLRLESVKEVMALPWNASPWALLGWPSIIIGLAIFIFATTRDEPADGARISMAATPFLSPYVGSQSWVSVLPALVKSKALYLVWAVGWGWIIYVLVR